MLFNAGSIAKSYSWTRNIPCHPICRKPLLIFKVFLRENKSIVGYDHCWWFLGRKSVVSATPWTLKYTKSRSRLQCVWWKHSPRHVVFPPSSASLCAAATCPCTPVVLYLAHMVGTRQREGWASREHYVDHKPNSPCWLCWKSTDCSQHAWSLSFEVQRCNERFSSRARVNKNI